MLVRLSLFFPALRELLKKANWSTGSKMYPTSPVFVNMNFDLEALLKDARLEVDSLPRRMVEAFFAGAEEHIRQYAYHRDGVQYVGSVGVTLAEALRHLEQDKQNALSVADLLFESVKTDPDQGGS